MDAVAIGIVFIPTLKSITFPKMNTFAIGVVPLFSSITVQTIDLSAIGVVFSDGFVDAHF
jgi:hypothetical protein